VCVKRLLGSDHSTLTPRNTHPRYITIQLTRSDSSLIDGSSDGSWVTRVSPLGVLNVTPDFRGDILSPLAFARVSLTNGNVSSASTLIA
jgi:hypothetical protein